MRKCTPSSLKKQRQSSAAGRYANPGGEASEIPEFCRDATPPLHPLSSTAMQISCSLQNGRVVVLQASQTIIRFIYGQAAAMLKTDTRQANWRRANPGKYDAHLAVQRAVNAGELEKQPCEVCGAEAVDAHHDQYDEPLTVRWLCRRHHTRLHHYGEDMFPLRNAP